MVFHPWMYALIAFGYALFGAVNVEKGFTPGILCGLAGVIVCFWMYCGSVKYWAK